MHREFLTWSRGIATPLGVLVLAACGLVPTPADFSPVPDTVHVVVWRASGTEMVGYVPVCPGDDADVGLSVDQSSGSVVSVGVAANDGVVEGGGLHLLNFRFAPDVVATGSVTDELPRADTAGGFIHPVTALDELGGFYVSTSRTYATADFDETLPRVGEGWVFVGGGTPRVAGELNVELEAALASVNCSEVPK